LLSVRSKPHQQRQRQTESESIESNIPNKMESRNKQEYLYSYPIKQTSSQIRRGKVGHYILVKGIMHQEDVMIINTYALNIDVPNFTK
jgi:hypothetical protein